MPSNWCRDKTAGDAAETRLANWFRTCGWEAMRTVGRADADLVVQTTIEVKLDRIAPASGHVAVEVERNGQPSGVLTSRAAYWAIVAGQRAVIVRTEVLRAAVANGGFRRVAAGDRRATTVCLIPWQEIASLPEAQVVEDC